MKRHLWIGLALIVGVAIILWVVRTSKTPEQGPVAIDTITLESPIEPSDLLSPPIVPPQPLLSAVPMAKATAAGSFGLQTTS